MLRNKVKQIARIEAMAEGEDNERNREESPNTESNNVSTMCCNNLNLRACMRRSLRSTPESRFIIESGESSSGRVVYSLVRSLEPRLISIYGKSEPCAE